MQVIATAGHVDHGKSTLIRALTGMEPDRHAEERRRGLTIDLGFAWTELSPGHTVAFVDVPGHERFVTTMLAGIGPVPAVLFVVAADEGWRPQSSEHRDALAALGTEHGLLVVTRSDLMEPQLAVEEAREYLAGTSLEHLTPVCVSAITGEGMTQLRTELAALITRLPVPDSDADVRMWVDRSFTIRGAGTVLTGTLPAGTITLDDELVLEPGGRPVRVRGLHSMDTAISEATGVARVAVNLRGVAKDTVGRGHALLAPERWLTTTVIDARLNPLHDDVGARRLPEQLSFHIGAAAVTARVRPLGAEFIRLTLTSPLPLRIGDRAVLRDPGARQIVGGLTVLDVRPPALTRRGAATRRATDLAAAPHTCDATAEVARRGLIKASDLTRMGADLTTLEQTAVLRAGAWLIHRDRATALATALAELISRHDHADPIDPGLPLPSARRELNLPDNQLLEELVAHSERIGVASLEIQQARVHRLDTASRGLAPRLRHALTVLRDELPNPFSAPEAHRLIELELGPKELAVLVKAGELDKLAPGVYLLPGFEQPAATILARVEPPDFTPSTARQVLGTNRRVIVPLLERLAERGLIQRGPKGLHRVRRRRV